MSIKVFISYKAEEFSQANWVKNKLEAAGFSCWMAPASIPGGSNYAMQIPQAIYDCDAFVIVVSARAQTSKWIPKEIDLAINANKNILPFVIEKCPLCKVFSFYLNNVQRYEAWKDKKSAIEDMICDIRCMDNYPRDNPEDTSKKVAENEIKRFRKSMLPFLGSIVVVLLAICIIIRIIVQNNDNPVAFTTGNDGANKPNNTITEGPTSETGTEISFGDSVALKGQEEEDFSDESISEQAIHYNTNGEVRILNKKYAQNAEFQRLANRFEEESGIKVKVESPSASSYSDALKEEIKGSKDDSTLFMLGGLNDFEQYGKECLELSDCAAAKELTDDSYTLRGRNGKVYGLACIVESYGLCVNTRLLEKAGYSVSEICSFADLKRVVRDISRRKDELGFSAFSSPSVGIGVSGDYRFSEHAPAVPLYYELKDNDFNIGMKLQGTYMNCFRDYVDLYLDNAVVPRSKASSTTLQEAQNEFLLEKAVFHQDGSWNLELIKDVMNDRAAVIPLYMGMPGEGKQGLNKTCSYFWCVNKNVSEDDKEASLQFLYWMVTSETGIRIMTEDMGFQIPYKKADVPNNIFFEVLREEEKQGLEPIGQFYKYGAYSMWINSIRKAIKDYADGTGDWSAVEDAFMTLW